MARHYRPDPTRKALPLMSVERSLVTKSALRRAVHAQFLKAGFSKDGQGYRVPEALDKQKIRNLHALNRDQRLAEERIFVEQNWPTLLSHFANGCDIEPQSISPELIEVVAGTPESNLFRLGTLLWSVPVSRGFGRRLRFLVRDRHNGKLIGIFALGDPSI